MSDMIDSTSDERTINNTMRHQYRKLSDEEKHAVDLVKAAGENFLTIIDDRNGREFALARTKMEEAVMWAVKGLTK